LSVFQGDEELKNVITVEGKLTHILYEPTEEEISLRKVYRNYESVLNRNDFEVLFSCEKEDCGAYLLNQMFSKSHLWKFFSSADFNGDPYAKFYYISARKELEGKLTYISYILYEYGPTYIIQDVLEVESVDDTLLEMNLNFDDMSKQGRVVLGGLFFDSGKATLLNESAESLELIANYVKGSKNKKFFVVGHTDSDGSHQLNLDLSLKRATAVVNELVTTFAVDKTQVLVLLHLLIQIRAVLAKPRIGVLN